MNTPRSAMSLFFLSLAVTTQFCGPVGTANSVVIKESVQAQQYLVEENPISNPSDNDSMHETAFRFADLGAEGRHLFLNNCAACHQEDGQGIPNVYPALAGSEVVNGSAEDVLYLLIAGRGDMPSFQGAFDNEEAQALLHYLISAWGNTGKAIGPDRLSRILEANP